MTLAVYPGSFDPFTLGHRDILLRSLKIIDQVVIAVGVKKKKKTLFTANERVEMIEKEISDVISDHKPFDLTISRTGCFPDSLKPSVLYLGVDNDLKALNDLVNKLSLKMTTLGYKRRDENFTPHVTIGKINYPQKFKPDLSIFLNSSYENIQFSVDKIQLLSSEVLSEGVVYNILNTFSLSKN